MSINPKSEYRNPKQIQISNVQNSKPRFDICTLNLDIVSPPPCETTADPPKPWRRPENLVLRASNLKRNSQEGVTLLISLLIMSGITLITLTVGFFAIQEVRSTRAILLTEPAIGAAETGGEQGVWAIKRDVTLMDCSSGREKGVLINNSKVESCKYYGAATIELEAGVNYSFYLYNPNDINGDVGLSDFSFSFFSPPHKP